MKNKLLYVELKSGYGDNGPAWIGQGFYSKTGQTVYFNGLALRKWEGISGNFYNLENYDEYWVSGVKKRGTNRHWAGGGVIMIDKTVIEEYLDWIGTSRLPKSGFQVVELNNVPAKKQTNIMENEVAREESFDMTLIYKPVEILSDDEITSLSEYYQNVLSEPRRLYKKNRKHIGESKLQVENEKLRRGLE